MIQGYANEIKKVADLMMQAEDVELDDEMEHMAWAANQIVKMVKRIDQT